MTTYHYDPYGRVSEIEYPEVTRPDSPALQAASTKHFYEGRRRQLSKTINAENHATLYFDFDSLHGLPQSVIREGAAEAELTVYDDMGNVLKTKRPQGGTGNDPANYMVYGLDGLYRVVTITDPKGKITTNSYDRESRLTSVLPPQGAATTTVYDKRGYVSGGTTPDGFWVQAVDANGNVRQKSTLLPFATTASILDKTLTEFDPLDRVIRLIQPGTSQYTGGGGGGGGPDRVTQWSYEEPFVDAAGISRRLSQETRIGAPANRVTKTIYDNRQRPIKVTLPDDLTVTETFYDEQDQVVATQLRYNTFVQTATLTYRDDRDRVNHVRMQDIGYQETLSGGTPTPGHSSDTYTILNRVGSVVQTVDPLGNPLAGGSAHKITNILDSRERVHQVVDGNGVVIRENVWGDDDLLVEVKVPDPETKSLILVTSETRTYTERKELKTVFNRNGTGLTYLYDDIQGQVKTVEDVQHRITRTTYYQATQRVDEVTVAEGTPNERRTKSVWQKGLLQEMIVWKPVLGGGGGYTGSYKYFYDRGDRLERFEAPLVAAERHSYNEFGEEFQFIAGTKTITYTYNPLGQRVSSEWSGAYNKTESRSYNEIGLLQSMSNAVAVGGAFPAGSLSKVMSYDNWHGTLSTEWFYTGNTAWKIQTHHYDVAKNYTGLGDAQGAAHDWVPDDNNRVEEIKYAGQSVCRVFYTPGGLIDKTQLCNDSGGTIAETMHYYDGLGRKVRQVTSNFVTQEILASFQWDYDSLDLVTVIKVNHLGVRADLQYNERRELKQEAWTGNNGGQDAPPFTNQTGAALTGHPESGPSNEPQATQHNALGIGAVTKSYTYDAAGNRKTMTVEPTITTYDYNEASQLKNESTPLVSSVDHFYDEWGNETSRVTTPSGGSPATETYAYNYLNLLADYQKSGVHWQYDYWPTGERYSKTNLNNVADNELYVSRFGDVVTDYSTATQLKNTYVQGTGVDSKCTRIPVTGERRHYLGDSVGTVSVTLTNAATFSSSETTLKDVWGVAFSGAPSSERYGFAQREQDNESGLVHMRARQYDPKVGRFTQMDPIVSNRPLQHYSYISNNPCSMTDPSGLKPGDWWDPRTYSLSDLKQGFGESGVAFGRGVKKGAVGLVEGVRDVGVGTYYGTKTLVTDPSSYLADVKTVYSKLPAAVVQSAKETVKEIKEDPTKVSELAGSITFDIVSAILLDKGASKLAAVVKDVRVLSRLGRVTETAVEFVDADVRNMRSLLKGKEVAQLGRGEMVEALRGKAIERMARDLVKEDPFLMRELRIGPVNKGPDLLRTGSNKWYDWTTTDSWPAHEAKYSGKGYHLNTDLK